MNQRQKKEQNEIIAASFGLVGFVIFMTALTNVLNERAPQSEQRGAWATFVAVAIVCMIVVIPWIARLGKLSESGTGGSWVFAAAGIGSMINFVVNGLPIWVRGAIMGLCVGFLLSVLIGGLTRIRRLGTER